MQKEKRKITLQCVSIATVDSPMSVSQNDDVCKIQDGYNDEQEAQHQGRDIQASGSGSVAASTMMVTNQFAIPCLTGEERERLAIGGNPFTKPRHKESPQNHSS